MPVLVGVEGEGAALPAADGRLQAEGASGSAISAAVEGSTSLSVPGGVAPHRRRRRPEVPPAETGRPETSKEFAARVSRNFVLKGPQQRKEGEGRQQTQQ
ncbi:hypothetical protein Hypma_004937 [Hypsizygus marmoreus]|uniref:Uncharacterized protein n=1 Tax=Hypsizygus marmoreus TaxID=39966 RepID=A0A369JX68_HYPMA|nr:hypothetical protein Hypma_004937 [Hypsizygus marmoreus]